MASPDSSSPRAAQVCTRCVMDTSDPDIRFDARGICHHCHAHDQAIEALVPAGAAATARLEALVKALRRAGRGRDHDCVIGVSGGVDSTFVAHALRGLGLRPLAVHVDNGWDSELAVKNIQNTLEKLGIELYTQVLDWVEFRSLQVAFLRASTPDSEIPSDHAIVATLFQVARRHGVRYVLSGCNIRSETHVPRAWSHGHRDWKYIRNINQRFGTAALRSYPHRDLVTQVLDRRRVRWVDVLNLMDYRKTRAMQVLEKELGWRYYGGKHFESIYTRFYQGHILPRKFGFDKRKAHCSSLICSGELSRESALQELTRAPYPEDQQAADRTYVVKKLGLTEAEFDAIMGAPPKRFDDYPSYEASRWYRVLRRAYRTARGRGGD